MPPNQTALLVDAHVHLHPCFDLADFLTAARTNFQAQAKQLDLSQPIVGALMLAEVSGVYAFADLISQQAQINQRLSDWTVSPTEEATSLRFTHTSGDTLLVIAGRQAVTQEKIEVLALATTADIPDGLSLEETLERAISADSLSVLPWGVGKWIGKRGKLVQTQLQAASQSLFAGDNGGRPNFWPLPAYCQNLIPLPGSDPLPLPSEVSRPGSFGFAIEGHFDWSQPGESLKQILRSSESCIQAYGRLQSPWQFVQNQSLLRLS